MFSRVAGRTQSECDFSDDAFQTAIWVIRENLLAGIKDSECTCRLLV